MIIAENLNLPTPLCELAKKYKTDKWWRHKYTPIYYDLFKDQKDLPLNIMEIGVFQGGSIKMWRDFFPNAKIFAVDIAQKYLDEVATIPDCIPIQVNANNELDITDKILNKYPNEFFDIIIDDAGHRSHQQLVTFCLLYPRIKNGYYIVEDIVSELKNFGIVSPTINYLCKWFYYNNNNNLILTLYNQLAIIKIKSQAKMDLNKLKLL